MGAGPMAQMQQNETGNRPVDKGQEQPQQQQPRRRYAATRRDGGRGRYALQVEAATLLWADEENDEAIAARLGISRRTLSRWKREEPITGVMARWWQERSERIHREHEERQRQRQAERDARLQRQRERDRLRRQAQRREQRRLEILILGRAYSSR